jgi:hypothetical protein
MMRGKYRVSVGLSLTYHYFLFFPYLSISWQTPINNSHKDGQQNGRFQSCLFNQIFMTNYLREPDNQRYLFVGASSMRLVFLTVVQAVITLQRPRPVVPSGNILRLVPCPSQPLPQPPFRQHSPRNPRNAASTPPAKRKPTTEVLIQLWHPHMVASELSLRL